MSSSSLQNSLLSSEIIMERDSKKRIETPPKGDEAVYCAVPRCKNVGGIRSKSSGITFHPFPVNDPQRMKAWGEAIHKRGFHPTDQSKICSTHFEPHCFDHSQPNVTLTADAMPTIFNTPLFSHSATRRKKARNKPRRSDYSAAGGIIEARIKEELDEDDDDVGQPDDEPTANDSLLAPALPDLRQKLLQFQKDGYLCDTTLMADDGEVKVHGVVLAATSTKFKASLDSQEGTVGHIISVPGVELYLLNIAVHFAYTGDIVVPKKNFSLNELPHVINVLLDLGFTIPTKNSSTSGASAMPTIECSFNASSRDGEPKLIAIDQVKLDGFDPENGDELVAFGDEENSTDTVLLTEIGNEAQDNESDLRQQHQLEEEEEADGDETSADVAGEQRAAGEPRVPNHKHCSLLCVTCGKLCSTSVKLLNHMRTHYGERNPYVCDDCGRHFSLPETLRRHRKLHSGIRPHLCQHCGKGFIRRGNLKDHVLLFHPELAGTEVEMYSCPHCHEQFPTYAKLVHHRRHYCGGQSVSGAPSTSTSSSSSSHKRRTSSSKRSTQFDCQTCGLLCPSNVAFAGHYQLHTGRSTHACAVCLAEFDDSASLSEHYFKHASDLPFFCVVCGRAFSLQALLNAHQKMHDASRPHMCRTCGKRFRMRASLTNHELVHSGEKPYVCSICDMRFRESNHVRRHLRVHTGERPYPCNLCEKTYKTRNDLRIHSRRIHQVEIPPKYGANYRSENSTGSMQGNAAFENTLVVNC